MRLVLILLAVLLVPTQGAASNTFCSLPNWCPCQAFDGRAAVRLGGLKVVEQDQATLVLGVLQESLLEQSHSSFEQGKTYAFIVDTESDCGELDLHSLPEEIVVLTGNTFYCWAVEGAVSASTNPSPCPEGQITVSTGIPAILASGSFSTFPTMNFDIDALDTLTSFDTCSESFEAPPAAPCDDSLSAGCCRVTGRSERPSAWLLLLAVCFVGSRFRAPRAGSGSRILT